MPLPNGTVFRIDLRTANNLAASLRVLQHLRKYDPQHEALEAVDKEHFDEDDGTKAFSELENNDLIDAIYNGSVLDIPEDAAHVCDDECRSNGCKSINSHADQDLCDQCGRSGVEIVATNEKGETACIFCEIGKEEDDE